MMGHAIKQYNKNPKYLFDLPLQGNTNDVSANRYNFTTVGTVTYPSFPAPLLGSVSAANWAGGNYLDSPAALGVRASSSSQNWIMSVWANTTNVASNGVFFYIGDSTNLLGDYFWFQFLSPTGHLRVGCSPGPIFIDGPVLSNNTWYNIVGIYNGTNIKTYTRTSLTEALTLSSTLTVTRNLPPNAIFKIGNGFTAGFPCTGAVLRRVKFVLGPNIPVPFPD